MLFNCGGTGMCLQIELPFLRQTHICLPHSQIFPNYLSLLRCKATALARIKEKRLELRAITGNTISPDGHVSM
jgi:hypothetical protein